MAKGSAFTRFMQALRRDWRSTMPAVRPVAAPCGTLPKASTFDAGTVAAYDQQIYLWFQTTWQEAGKFTVNVVVADPGEQASAGYVGQDFVPGERLRSGGHRIGRFVGDHRHDKWWHLCEVERRTHAGGDPQRWLDLRNRLRRGNWQAGEYADEGQVVAGAVADVTADVRTALRLIGCAATPDGA
jgi:hypothetical protein